MAPKAKQESIKTKTFSSYSNSKTYGLFGGILLFVVMQLIPAPEAIGEKGWDTLSVMFFMLAWWMTEAVPIPAAALLPIVLFPVLEVLSLKDATAAYSDPIVYLFMGGFVIAVAMEKWHLHKRIALGILKLTGTHANGIVFGFMAATAFLSMWMSNTATTVMMLPIALSVLQLILKEDHQVDGEMDPKHRNLALTLMLGVAFAASIGGTATLIGTPPNAAFAGFMNKQYDIQINFAEWMMFALPFSIILLGICWVLLVLVLYPNRMGHIEGSGDIIDEQYKKLGKMDRGEKSVLIVFIATACCWMFKKVLPFDISDTAIAITAAISMFVIPVKLSEGKFLLKWEDMARMPWGILLLFGGGLSLATAIDESGLVQTVGGLMSQAGEYNLILIVIGIGVTVMMFTEVMSNIALITIFLPVLAGIAVRLGENPLLLAISATLCSSCAFMLPMSTPPNAIVFASGHIRIPQMAKAGVILNICALLLITLFTFTAISWIYGIEPGIVPDWAQRELKALPTGDLPMH